MPTRQEGLLRSAWSLTQAAHGLKVLLTVLCPFCLCICGVKADFSLRFLLLSMCLNGPMNYLLEEREEKSRNNK